MCNKTYYSQALKYYNHNMNSPEFHTDTTYTTKCRQNLMCYAALNAVSFETVQQIYLQIYQHSLFINNTNILTKTLVCSKYQHNYLILHLYINKT